MSLVVDASVLVDVFAPREEGRRRLAIELLRLAQSRPKYAPNILLVELAGVISRYDTDLAELAVDYARRNMILLDEAAILATCLDVAFRTGCRASDAYYIATAKLTNSTLISNDRIQVENARKAGIAAYYLIGERDAVLRRLGR
ncbi:PIN domain-containing protein [Candidatus Bathyarchaeota archaeon]|nr:MAG: PIN domain-containing protein [Candidatus Bathyarchaeota archaeon]